MSVETTNRGRRLLSALRPYRPTEQGKTLFDGQYAGGEWDYLRSIGEAPRFGIVSAYCRLLATGGAVLEIGCGEGILVEQLDRSRFAQIMGVDISSVAIERARALEDERTSFVTADAETYVPERPYELIVFNEVLEYLDDPLGALRRYEAFLSPGGHFVVSMFAAAFTAQSPRIWRRLQSQYDVRAHTRLSTGRDYVWNVKVLRPHPGS